MSGFKERLSEHRKMYIFLMILTMAATAGLQAWMTLFDNFAVNVVGIEGKHMGVIQSVREIPGLLALLAIYFLFILKEHHLSALSVIILGLGIAMTGFFPSFYGLLLTTLLMSFGYHYFETTNQSLTLQYFDQHTAPWVFGKLRSVAAASNIAIGVTIFIIQPLLSFEQLYLWIGIAIIAAGLFCLSLKPTDQHLVPQHKKMILKKKYFLYYFLTFMAGARRQIFTAFAVFLLVKQFDCSVREITFLFVINNVINYFLNPLIGRAIIFFGERKILSIEYSVVFFIFMAYALASSKYLVWVLYILDQIFFNFSIAIRTYFQKIGDPRDIAPSMAVGFTINHIAAVALPVIGGLLWMIDYRIPFVAGAVLSLISLAAVQKIKV